MNEHKRRTIFAACRELKLTTENRHDLQLVTTGKDSMADMTDDDADLMIAALKERGFKHASKGRGRKTAPRADLRYMHVLWGLLRDAGKLKKPGRDGLNAFVRTRFGDAWGAVPADVDMLADAAKINDITRALKDWCKREGIETERKRDANTT